MNIITVRRISQIFFLVLFLWFCVVSSFGERWWQLRGWPVNWILQLDPLVALGTILTTRTLYAGLAWALLTMVLTVLLGRFFCGWLCPFGTIHQFFGWIGHRKQKFAERVAANHYRPAQVIKYYLLVGLLTAAAGNVFADFFHVARQWPMMPGLVLAIGLAALSFLAIRKIVPNLKTAVGVLLTLVGAWLAVGMFLHPETLFTVSLQIGWLDPIPLIHRSVNLVLLPIVHAAMGTLSTSPRFYVGAWTIGAVFLAAVLLNFLVPRFYCRFICPLGALFAVLGGPALWRVGKREGQCTNCELCENNCEGACEPFEKIRSCECLLCMNCLDACQQAQMTYSTARSAAGELPGPNISRRGFIISAVTGVTAVPMMRLSGLLGANWQPRVVRPAGRPGRRTVSGTVPQVRPVHACLSDQRHSARDGGSRPGRRVDAGAELPRWHQRVPTQLRRLRPNLSDSGHPSADPGRETRSQRIRLGWPDSNGAGLCGSEPLFAVGDGEAVYRLPGELSG